MARGISCLELSCGYRYILNHGYVALSVVSIRRANRLQASQGAGLISETIASQPPEAAIKAEARHSMIVPEKMFHSKVHDLPGSEDASEHEHRDRSWDVDLSLFPAPTEEEEKTLRKVAGSIPWVAYCLCVVELAERASYYGAQTVFANFLTYPLPHGMIDCLHSELMR